VLFIIRSNRRNHNNKVHLSRERLLPLAKGLEHYLGVPVPVELLLADVGRQVREAAEWGIVCR